MKRKISPTNDFLFKCLFGRKGSEDVLLAFLNAVMQDCGQPGYESVQIMNDKELPKEKIDGKMSVIDIRATLPDQSKVNIEIQVSNEKNMEKRTLYYWSKLYTEDLKKGQNYNELMKVMTINIIEFDYYKEMKYHNRFKVMNVDSPHQVLTDDLEIHFIQLPKYRVMDEKDFQNNRLHRWLTFLDREIPDDLLEELTSMDTHLKEANDKLESLLADDETLALAEARETAIIEWNSQLNYAKESGMKIGHEKGKEEGREEGRLEERKKVEKLLEKEKQEKINLIRMLVAAQTSLEKISDVSGFTIDEIKKLL